MFWFEAIQTNHEHGLLGYKIIMVGEIGTGWNEWVSRWSLNLSFFFHFSLSLSLSGLWRTIQCLRRWHEPWMQKKIPFLSVQGTQVMLMIFLWNCGKVKYQWSPRVCNNSYHFIPQVIVCVSLNHAIIIGFHYFRQQPSVFQFPGSSFPLKLEILVCNCFMWVAPTFLYKT